MFFMPNLDTKYVCWPIPRPLVSTSVCCSLVAMCSNWTKPSWTLFLMKWQSMSMCLVLSWKTELAGIWIADLLSQNKSTGPSICTPSSPRRPVSQTTSATVEAILLYSASAELLKIVCYFLDFQDIKESPSLSKYLVIDLLVTIHDTQSASQYVVRWGEAEADINTPKPGDCLTYLTILVVAIIWDTFREYMNWLRHWIAKAMSGLVIVN